jgi:hypothetical protein
VTNIVSAAFSFEISLINVINIEESECEFKGDRPYFIGWLREAFVEMYGLTAEMNTASELTLLSKP